MPNTIAILATGDELIHGDILNTSTPWLANQLIEHGFDISTHMATTDKQTDIEKSLCYLLDFNKIVITTGGLGPTSDDRTRYAIANVANRDLAFDETSWQMIETRLRGFNIPVTDNNKQQALFPEGAVILTNKNGTANGCIIEFDNKIIVMLPGPPFECRELFNEFVLNKLLALQIHQQRFVKKWRIFNVSESDIASKLDPIIEQTQAIIGYRVDYPYLEIKLYCQSDTELQKLQAKISSLLNEKFLADEYVKATDKLARFLEKNNIPMLITDKATKGYWQYQLLNITSLPFLSFNPDDIAVSPELHVTITGLNAFWQGDTHYKNMELEITIASDKAQMTQQYTVPLRGKRSLAFAAELMSCCLYEFITGRQHNACMTLN